MSLSGTLGSVESALSKVFGILDKTEAKVASITAMGSKFADAISKVTAGAQAASRGSSGGGGGGMMPTSLGNVPPIPEASGRSNVNFSTSGGGGGGGAGGGAGGSGGGGMAAMAASPQGRAVSIAAGVASAAYNLTPGLPDAMAIMGGLFPTAYAATGPYDRMAIGRQTAQAIGQGASGAMDPAMATALAAARGFVFSPNDNSVPNMLKGAEFAYTMTGMSNPAAVSGLTDLYRGASGVNDRLLEYGINTVDSNGDLRDPGAIVNQLLKRHGIDNMTEEDFNKSLSMGYIGQTFNYMFGDSPELYAQAVALARTQVKAGGKKLLLNDGSAMAAAQEQGLEDSPWLMMGKTQSAQFAANVEASEGLMTGGGLTQQLSTAMYRLEEAIIGNTGVLGDFVMFLKGGWQGGTASVTRSTGGNIQGAGTSTHDSIPAVLAAGEYVINSRAAKLIGREQLDEMNSLGHEFGSGFASPAPVFLNMGGVPKQDVHRDPEGKVDGLGSSTHDSIPAVLAAGEYVINSRAAKLIGEENLQAMNSLGHEFGSGFASPAPVFLSKGGSASGGDSISGSQIVDFAEKYVGEVPYIPSHTIRDKGKSPGPENGWDCSTFVQWVYGQFGVNTPGYSDDFLKFGTSVNKEDLKPGDILVWNTMSDRTAGHVSIYAGNGEHVHAANKNAGTVRGKISDWYWSRFIGARRVAADTLDAPSEDLGEAKKSDPGISDLLAGINFPPPTVVGLRAAAFSTVQAFSLSGLGKSTSGAASSNTAMFAAAATPASAKSGMESLTGVSDMGDSALGGLGSLLQGGPLGMLGNAARKILSLFSGDSESEESKEEPKESSTPRRGSYGAKDAMSDTDLLNTLQRAGFKGERLREAWAIVMRESNGRPMAHNLTPGVDNSYGMFQINFDPAKLDPKKRHDSFLKYVEGYTDRSSLFDPDVAARAAAYMSQKGKNWKSWVSPTYGRAKDFYEDFPTVARKAGLPGYSHGSEYVSKDQTANLHQGELVMPAAQAQMFREVLQETLSGARGKPQEVNITLHIDKASDEEAERFAKKVISIVQNNDRRERMAVL
jgi:cell wall-associated NlpC family hydrolase